MVPLQKWSGYLVIGSAPEIERSNIITWFPPPEVPRLTAPFRTGREFPLLRGSGPARPSSPASQGRVGTSNDEGDGGEAGVGHFLATPPLPDNEKFPVPSAQIYKDISDELGKKWTPFNVYVNVKKNRREIVTLMRRAKIAEENNLKGNNLENNNFENIGYSADGDFERSTNFYACR